MNPTERILAVLDGKPVDRLQTFYPGFDAWPTQQVLGKPLISGEAIFRNPLTRKIFDKWGPKLVNLVTDPAINADFMKAIQAAIAVGFDLVWVGPTEGQVMVWNSTTLLRYSGSFYELTVDGHGNMYYMYREPAFNTTEDYYAWPYFVKPDDAAQKSYKFFTKAMKKYGDKICVMPQVQGLHETMVLSLGFVNMAVFVKKEPQLLQHFIAYLEAYAMKLCMAMLDAGVKVILLGDDFSNKTGPSMNPKINDELFGASYQRITKAVHDRGGRIILHSCGDNTKMFDYFIKWGFDGGHAYENTSNVDIYKEKERHGDQFTIVGGVGVDYLLTEHSKPHEVEEGVKKLIDALAPGGRFIIGPVHTHPDMDMSKVKIMMETVRRHGNYPI